MKIIMTLNQFWYGMNEIISEFESIFWEEI